MHGEGTASISHRTTPDARVFYCYKTNNHNWISFNKNILSRH